MHLNEKIIISLIQESLDGLFNSAMIDCKIHVDQATPLFGSSSNIDSMSFVALVTDVEDRISRMTGKDYFIVLSDIEELYPNDPTLTAGMLASYLVGLSDA